MQTSPQGISLIKRSEGCRLTAYQDAIGVWTIGYGWTQRVNSQPITAGMTITQQTADALLLQGLPSYEQGVSELVEVALNQQQFDALIDFSWNLGVGALKNSTLLRKLNAGDYQGAADEFLKWNKAGGKVLPGLSVRRQAEYLLFRS